MSAKHTPGPWNVDLAKVGKNGRTPINGSNWWGLAKVVVRMDGDKSNTRVGEANARLIAAAPDLYEVVADIVSDCQGAINPGLYELAVAAIAKAEGRS